MSWKLKVWDFHLLLSCDGVLVYSLWAGFLYLVKFLTLVKGLNAWGKSLEQEEKSFGTDFGKEV